MSQKKVAPLTPHARIWMEKSPGKWVYVENKVESREYTKEDLIKTARANNVDLCRWEYKKTVMVEIPKYETPTLLKMSDMEVTKRIQELASYFEWIFGEHGDLT